MEKYEDLEVEVIEFEGEDVILTSGEAGGTEWQGDTGEGTIYGGGS